MDDEPIMIFTFFVIGILLGKMAAELTCSVFSNDDDGHFNLLWRAFTIFFTMFFSMAALHLGILSKEQLFFGLNWLINADVWPQWLRESW